MIESDKKSGKLHLKSKVGSNKVQIFLEGHKNLAKVSNVTKGGESGPNLCGLLKITELYYSSP